MQKEIDFYDDMSTPYKYSYSPYTKIWYNDAIEQMPEPSTEAEKVTSFKITDEPGEEKEDFEKYVKYICGEKDLWFYDTYSASLLLKSEKYKKYINIEAWI